MALRQRVSCIFFLFALLLFVSPASPPHPPLPLPSTSLPTHVTVGGSLRTERNSPFRGVRAGVTSRKGPSLLRPARCFPRTNSPSSRSPATSLLNVPDTFAVAGTGKAAAPTPMAAKNALEGGR